jgi:hypothetical protein
MLSLPKKILEFSSLVQFLNHLGIDGHGFALVRLIPLVSCADILG